MITFENVVFKTTGLDFDDIESREQSTRFID